MKKFMLICLAITMLLGFGRMATAEPVVWTGPMITFTKPDGADCTDPQNQDRITDNVWITRDNKKGIFNIKQEISANNWDPPYSPVDTEWAEGSAADWQSLTFVSWYYFADEYPRYYLVGKKGVLHLITDDIYIDIEFTSWSCCGAGGFSYKRSTPCTLDLTIKKAEIDFKDKPSSDKYKVKGEATFLEMSDGIDPLVEDVSVTVGTSSLTIPAGSFEERGATYEFHGIIDGVKVKMKIKEVDIDIIEFDVKADGVDLTGTSNPVDIYLTIGLDKGDITTKLYGKLKYKSGKGNDDDEDEKDDG
jgi:hypothetical protein